MMRRPRPNALHHAPARARTLTLQTAQRARRARRELLVIVPLVILTIVAYVERERLFGIDLPIRVAAALLGSDDAVTRGEAPDDDLADDGGRPADRGLRPRPGRVSQGFGS